MSKQLIMDVSAHQKRVDFKKAKAAGVKAVLIRVGWRGYLNGCLSVDPRFEEYAKGAAAAGLPIGGYWYTTALSVREAEAEADFCVRQLRLLGHKISFPVFLDLEYAPKRQGRADHLPAKVRTANAVAFLERVRSLGYEAGVYCNPDFWLEALQREQLEGYPRWIARYSAACPMGCDIWQWTSTAKGSKYGVEHEFVDLDWMLTDFPAGEQSRFQKPAAPPSATGNPYRAPGITVASSATAAALKLKNWMPQGEGVKAVQFELKRLGYEFGAVDGIMGPKTDAAVAEFQAAAGLVVDKAVGPKTWAALVACKNKPVAVTLPERPINWRKRVADAAKKVYPLCIDKVHGGKRAAKVVSLATLKKYKALTCNRMVSIALQQAGCLPEGYIIAHTAKGGKKKFVTDAVKGTERLKHCKVYWVDKRYDELRETWKRAGVVYIQDSSACISAGNGKCWTCNKGVGAWYKVRGDYLKDEGYWRKSKILVVIVPDEGLTD